MKLLLDMTIMRIYQNESLVKADFLTLIVLDFYKLYIHHILLSKYPDTAIFAVHFKKKKTIHCKIPNSV